MDHHGKSAAPCSEPAVSVVIPSYNSRNFIRQCLTALREQQTHLIYEIIVVDSSQDNTNEIISNEFPEVRLFHFAERCSVGKARNIGVQNARADIVLFIDSDCVADPSWLEQMVQALNNHNAQGVCGAFANGTAWSITGTVAYYLEFFRFLPYRGHPYETSLLLGGNSGFRKSVFEIALYHHASIADDFLFSMRLSDSGLKLLFQPTIAVHHLNKTGFRKILKYQYKLGLGAYNYRRQLSPGIIRCLNKMPLLAFLMPNAVMIWVGSIIFKREGLLSLLKFIAILPVAYIANMAWATGFYKGLKQSSASGNSHRPVP